MKKPDLDSSDFSNFSQFQNLPFYQIFLLEMIVFMQLQSVLNAHSILEKFQSGFKALHSTETALLKVFNDLLLAPGSDNSAALLLLDLTAAFDAADHRVLISRLEQCGVKGSALD